MTKQKLPIYKKAGVSFLKFRKAEEDESLFSENGILVDVVRLSSLFRSVEIGNAPSSYTAGNLYNSNEDEFYHAASAALNNIEKCLKKNS